MELPPSVPSSLSEKPWLVESYRDDRLLVDSSLFDVQPYRSGRVESLLLRIDEWNREDAQPPLVYHEYNWVEEVDGRGEWRRCYGLPTDGIHRASAAKQAGVPAWVTITAYYFERESVERYGLPADRGHLKEWLVEDGDYPRPLHELIDLPHHQPQDLLESSQPDEDGLLGFGDAGGVVRVRLFEPRERTVILFSAVPNALGQGPCASLTGQVAAMQSIWEMLLLGRLRHPLDAEWWADAAGDDEKWHEASAEVTVSLDDEGGYRFDERPARSAGAIDMSPLRGRFIAHTGLKRTRKGPKRS